MFIINIYLNLIIIEAKKKDIDIVVDVDAIYV